MKWKHIDPPDKLLEGSDPYFHWRLGIGARKRDAELERPVVIGLANGVTASQFAIETDASHLRVPQFYTNPIPGLESLRWCTAFAKPGFFQSLAEDERLRASISRISVQPPFQHQEHGSDALADSDPPFIDAGDDAEDAPDDAVVIGIIDYGLAFAHERFRRTKEKTRIEYLWVQDGPRASSQTEASNGANPVPYGREISARHINGWLSESSSFVSEDSIYRNAAKYLGKRWLRSVSGRVAHGTHVMDLACGYDLSDKERAKRELRPIVCVQLPEATTADTSGENLDSYVLDGIRYILERADEIARRKTGRKHLPVVVNLSFGNVAGPHDGTSNLEAALDELIKLVEDRRKKAPLNVVIPSGNSHLGRLHAVLDFPRPEPKDNPDNERFDPNSEQLRWRIQPDDRTPSFLEIWLPPANSENEGSSDETMINPRAQSPISLAIKPPGSVTHKVLKEPRPGAGLQLLTNDGEVLCEARYRYISEPPTNRDESKPTGRGMFLVALQPTRRNEPEQPGLAANPVAPSGVWTVALSNEGQFSGRIEAWIQRDDTPYSFPRRGRQSYFDEPCYERFDHGGRAIEDDSDRAPCIIKRDGSMNAIATGRKTIVIGGYLGKEKAVAMYSAGGPTSSAHRSGPDALAVSDDSIVHRGVLAAGTRSGSVVALNGTSVAAPQVARLVAGQLADGGLGEAGERSSNGRKLVEEIAKGDENANERGVGLRGRPMPEQVRGGAGRIARLESVSPGRAPRSEFGPSFVDDRAVTTVRALDR